MTNAGLLLSGLEKSFGSARVVCGVDLAVARGTILALLGPSGCGKTTLLRLIAGFEWPDAGSVTLDDQRFADSGASIPPHRRGIAFVPQDGALFPYLSVADNIGFGLARVGRADRVGAMLDLIGLSGFAARAPHELSGGQQQRVALARALAPDPDLVLLDEPFNALDASLRRTLCADIRRILKARGATAIFVTHDRDEAFGLADRLAVMREGSIVQVGVPRDVYDTPVDLETASLVGVALHMPGRRDGAWVQTVLGRLAITDGVSADGPDVTVLLRPEQVVRAPEGTGVRVAVRDQTFLGPLVWLELLVDEVALQACWPAAMASDVADEAWVTVQGRVRVFVVSPTLAY